MTPQNAWSSGLQQSGSHTSFLGEARVSLGETLFVLSQNARLSFRTTSSYKQIGSSE
jgi:hypothetical protein